MCNIDEILNGVLIMLTGLNKNPEHCDVSLSLLKCYGRCWKSGNVREHFQCLMLFPCKFAKPGLQVVDGLIWCLPMPAARKEEWASWYYLGLEELDPSVRPLRRPNKLLGGDLQTIFFDGLIPLIDSFWFILVQGLVRYRSHLEIKALKPRF